MTRSSESLVSIIIPCYNAERWIAATVQSALSQTYGNIEVIAVDDASTDRTPQILRQFGGRIRAFFAPSNRGPCAARNVGLRWAQGDWIQFLDADDLLHPEKIRAAMRALGANPDVEFIWAPYTHVDETFSLSIPDQSSAWDPADLQVTTSRDSLRATHAPWAAVFRRSLLARVGDWNESLKGWDDLEYHARIAAQRPLYAKLAKPLYYYREHQGERVHLSERNPANIRRDIESLRLARAALEASEIPPRDWKDTLWGFYLDIAKSSAVVGDKKTYRQFILEAAELRGTMRFRLKCYMAMCSAELFGLKLTRSVIERAARPRVSPARAVTK
jgi:glycosyltransferase involved in cell wall biosynthesis